MMSIEKKIEYLELLENLSEAFGENDDQTPGEIRNEFIEDGFDIDTAVTNILAFQKKISMKARRQVLDEAKSRRERKISMGQRILKKIRALSDEQVKERIEELLRIDPDLAISHRDLEAKKEEDRRSLLEDIEITRLMSESDD